MKLEKEKKTQLEKLLLEESKNLDYKDPELELKIKKQLKKDTKTLTEIFFQQENLNKKSNFRLRGKKLFLTYPSINGVYKTLENGEIEVEKTIEYSKETRENIKEIALKQIQNKNNNIKEYLIGEEMHADGIHF